MSDMTVSFTSRLTLREVTLRGPADGSAVRQDKARPARKRRRRSSGSSRKSRRVFSLSSLEYAQPTYWQRGQLPASS